jgi:dihydrofolate reductase
MRKVIVTEFMSLDGVMESPEKWSLSYWDDEIGKLKFDELSAADALLLGRVTYEGFAAAWPSRTDETGYADRMNNLPKYVVSTTLSKPEWNNTQVIKGDLAGEVTRLKQQPGQSMLVFGSAQLAAALLEEDLVDEYRLLVYPVVLGAGKRLFSEANKAGLRLLDVKKYNSGVVLLTYGKGVAV